MSKFSIVEGTPEERASVESWIESLHVNDKTRAVSAWVSSLHHSMYGHIEDVPYSVNAPNYRLIDHVTDVVIFGRSFADVAEQRYHLTINRDTLDNILLLHDLDKPLLYEKKGETIQKSDVARMYPHGVLGATMLRALNYSDEVISIVATHADSSPFHGRSHEAWILHYADFFATDHVILTQSPDVLPFYQRKD